MKAQLYANSQRLNAKGYTYYHPDHLGSTSFITDTGGEVSQHEEIDEGDSPIPIKNNKKSHRQYIPFGESLVSEHANNGYNAPWKFNGKEFDEDSRLYYYGARYYDPRISIWMGVDPLAEEYPSWSPYAYTFNNPVRYIDPTGMEPEGGEDPPGKLTLHRNGTIKMVGGPTITFINPFSNFKNQDLYNEDGKLIMKHVSNDLLNFVENYNVDGTLEKGCMLTDNKQISLKDAKKFFAVLAKNSDVEWSFMAVKKGDDIKINILTSYTKDEVTYCKTFDSYIKDDGYKIIEDWHSHPGKSYSSVAYPSGYKRSGGIDINAPGDRGHYEQYKKYFADGVNAHIFLPGVDTKKYKNVIWYNDKNYGTYKKKDK